MTAAPSSGELMFLGAIALFVTWSFTRPRRDSTLRPVVPPPPLQLPRGFIAAADEHVLFSTRARCALPTTQTRTYGMFGPIGAAESDARIVTGQDSPGTLTITNQRVIVNCRSDVREWPIASISSAYADVAQWRRASTLTVRIANVGAARFKWDSLSGAAAEDALKIARTGEA